MSTAVQHPPPLMDGDRLTLDEFLRRWEAMPDLKRAELLDGVVCLSSPVGREHYRPEFHLTGWAHQYMIHTPGCEGGHNATWLMMGNSPQPDVHIALLPEYGGLSHLDRGLMAGVPELAVEVAYSSASRDQRAKLALYERAGVPEYLLLLVKAQRVEWRMLVGGKYQLLQPDPDGLLRSRIFPGLWLDPAAALAGDGPRLIAALQQGLASPEHAAFVCELAAHQTRVATRPPSPHEES